MNVLQIKQAPVMGDCDQLLLHGRNLPFPSRLQTFLPFNSQTLKKVSDGKSLKFLIFILSASCPRSSYQERFLFSFFEGQFYFLCGHHSLSSSHRLSSGLALISFICNPALSSEFLSPPSRWDHISCIWGNILPATPLQGNDPLLYLECTPPPPCGMEFVTLLPTARGVVIW